MYPALRRLERAGLVRPKWEADAIAKKAKRPRRRYYAITKEGSVALQGALERFPLLRQPSAGFHRRWSMSGKDCLFPQAIRRLWHNQLPGCLIMTN